MKKYFETLGLKECANQGEIQAAYDRLSKELDPKNNNDQEFFKEEYEKVQEAYEVLYNSSILATHSTKIKKNGRVSNKTDSENNNQNPKPKPKRKSFFSKENLFLVLLIIIIGQILYLQTKVYEVTKYVDRSLDNTVQYDYESLVKRVKNDLETERMTKIIKDSLITANLIELLQKEKNHD